MSNENRSWSLLICWFYNDTTEEKKETLLEREYGGGVFQLWFKDYDDVIGDTENYLQLQLSAPSLSLAFFRVVGKKKGKSLFKEQVLGAWELWLFWESVCVTQTTKKCKTWWKKEGIINFCFEEEV